MTYLSAGCYALTGYKPEEFGLNGVAYSFIVHPSDLAQATAAIQAQIAKQEPYTIQYRIYTSSGQVKWVWDQGHAVFDRKGKLLGLAGLISDITEFKQIEASLQESQQGYALAARIANDGLWDWNLKTKEVYFSPRWKSMLGYAETEINHDIQAWLQRVHPQDIKQLKVALAAHLEGLTPEFANEHRMKCKDGTYRWMLSRGIALRDAQAKAYRLAGSQTDITERKLNEARLQHDTFHDQLTELPNRKFFIYQLRQALQKTKQRQDYLFAVLFLDMDRFQIINDSLGPELADQLLMAIACRLKACLPPEHTLAKLEGDKFIILLNNLHTAETAKQIAQTIQAKISLPFELDGCTVYTTVSIGIALSSGGYSHPEEIVRDAATTMYYARAIGKGSSEVFTQTMRTRVTALLQLETELHQALKRCEFRLYYQPIVSLKNDRTIGFEALLRWMHPTRGLVAPAEFIPIAEETGLITTLDEWVLRQACYQLKAWQQKFPIHQSLSISVNFSAKQFSQPKLIEQVNQVLQQSSVNPQNLKLEITETTLIENIPAVADRLLELKALGVQLYLDDFGTGYSSLSYLHQLPIDCLKIDRSFVCGMGHGKNSEIVKTIVALAQTLEIDAVAEGVETREQLIQLKSQKCKYAQGFFLSKPLDCQAAETWLIAEASCNPSSRKS